MPSSAAVDPLGDIVERLPRSSHEHSFEAFLKEHQLHHTQSVAGLGWLDRNISRSVKYSYSAALDVANPALRTLMPNVMGKRGLFRFMFPPRQLDPQQEPHLAVSDRQLYVPELELTLPKNPLLHLDIAGFLLLVKGRATRFLGQHRLLLSAHNITALMALWFALSDIEQRFDPELNRVVPMDVSDPEELAEWLREEVPVYLLLYKFATAGAQPLTLTEARAAVGIPAHRLAVLYPPPEKD